jgi:uncharacterized damage-inducible protein DinB
MRARSSDALATDDGRRWAPESFIHSVRALRRGSVIESDTMTPEHADLLEALARQRSLLQCAARGLTDAQARLRPTASSLTLGGLIKHVTAAERSWAAFIAGGPAAFPVFDESTGPHGEKQFTMLPAETLEQLLSAHTAVGRRTDEVVRGLADLGMSHPLPAAVPWSTPGARWSARRTLVHIIAETAQHAGHADILREAIDGRKTMG